MVGRRAVGIIFLLLVVVLWVGSSELIQLIFDNPRYAAPLTGVTHTQVSLCYLSIHTEYEWLTNSLTEAS